MSEVSFEEHQELQTKQKKTLTDFLEERGIKMTIWGCGCCSSPAVSLEYNGELLLDDVCDCGIDMLGIIPDDPK